MAGLGDFDYFGKGLEGYVQYMQTVDQTTSKDDEVVTQPVMNTPTEFYDVPAPPTSPVPQSKPAPHETPVAPPETVRAACPPKATPKISDATPKKSLRALKFALLFLGAALCLWLLTR